MLIAVGLLLRQRLRLLGEDASANFIAGLQLDNGLPYLLHGFPPAALQQTLTQLVKLRFRLRLLGGRQQHLGFNQHQVGGHGDKLAGNLHIQLLHFVQVRQILLQNGSDGNILNLYFVFAEQKKNHIQRPLKILAGFGFGVNDSFQLILRFSHIGAPILPFSHFLHGL